VWFVGILLNDYVLKFMGSMCVFSWNFVEGLCVETMVSMCDFVGILLMEYMLKFMDIMCGLLGFY
jgi:hypothetical protein